MNGAMGFPSVRGIHYNRLALSPKEVLSCHDRTTIHIVLNVRESFVSSALDVDGAGDDVMDWESVSAWMNSKADLLLYWRIIL